VALLRFLLARLSSGFLRLVVIAGVVVLLYLAIVKPLLKTGTEAIRTSDQTIQRSLGSIGLGNVNKTFENLSAEVQRQVQRALDSSARGGGQQRLLACIQHADGRIGPIRRCTRRY
jgi:hypothetical protein